MWRLLRCLARQVKKELLRFTVGDAVECRMGPEEDNWARGAVVALMVHEEVMPQGVVAAYQVELDDDAEPHSHGAARGGRRVWAPLDADDVIRLAARGPGLRRRSGRLKGTGRGADDHVCDDPDGHHHHGDAPSDFRMMCHEGAIPPPSVAVHEHDH